MICIALFLFFGCSAKELRIFSPDKPYIEALRYTASADIAVSLENKAMIIATYLDPLEKKYRDGEYFFVRVYINDDFEDQNRSGLYHPGYSLTLNKKKPLWIKGLDFDDPLVKRMPFVQKWYKIYLVKFPKIEKKKLQLIFAHEAYGKVVLNFQNIE